MKLFVAYILMSLFYNELAIFSLNCGGPGLVAHSHSGLRVNEYI